MAKPSREYIHGINPAFEVVRAGRRKIYEAYLNEHAEGNPRLRKLATFLAARDIPVQSVDKKRLFELAQSKEHQGVVLKTSPYVYAPAGELFEEPRLLLLDNVEDPHNVGAILRSAEVFGFHGVLMPARGVPEIYPSVVKVSAGAAEHLRVAKESSSNRLVKAAREAGYTIIALDMKGTETLDGLARTPREKLLLVVGGEARAVGQFILNTADHVARIEQRGRVNSLNASVAAGIAMFALAGSQS